MPVKKKKTSAPRRGNKKLMAPSFDNWEKLSGADFHKLKTSVNDFYYMNYKYTDTIDWCFQWMSSNGYTKQEVQSAKKAIKYEQVLGVRCKMMLDGCPDFNEKEQEYWQSCAGTSGDIKPMSEWIKAKIEKAIEVGGKIVAEKKEEESKKKNIYVPTIKERLQETCGVMTEQIEEFVDDFCRNPDKSALKKFDPVSILRKLNAKPGHARMIRGWYTDERNEYAELVNQPTPAQKKKMSEHDLDMLAQLKEGYSHLSKADAKMFLELFSKIVTACEIIEAEAKTTRKPRKIKVKSPEDLTKNMKFKPSDTQYGIASVSPAKLIGANIAVVFNCKTRKLGMYYASNVDPKGLGRPGSGFSVKGTTLQGFDESKSVQRTIRKPNEFLPQVKKTTRSKTEKMFATIKTTETKLNGRFNTDTILLAVF